MIFSKRLGIRPIKAELEKNGLSIELRNMLWTVVVELILEKKSNMVARSPYGSQEAFSPLTLYFRDLWMHFYKLPIDNLPVSYGCVNEIWATKSIRDWFFKAEWDQVYDFIEFSSTYDSNFPEICNVFLKREMSAYRFIENSLAEINSEQEVLEVQSALKIEDKFSTVKAHLQRSLELYSDRKNPDFRNSIKESISSVESLARIIIGDDNATLGKALKEIEKKHQLPAALKAAFSSLYGYTSEEGGIRHCLLENGVSVDIEESRFMLIACSAFVNYLICKI
jgi:hypothetical protein